MSQLSEVVSRDYESPPVGQLANHSFPRYLSCRSRPHPGTNAAWFSQLHRGEREGGVDGPEPRDRPRRR